MPHCKLLLAVVALAFAGCDVQHGRFVTTGTTSVALSPNSGCINIVSGYEVSNQSGVNEQNLLYVMIVCSDATNNGSSGSEAFGSYVTTLNNTWNTVSGPLTVSIAWNRQSDTITVGQQTFSRTNGNVIFVRLKTNEKTVAQQLTGLGPHIAVGEVLEHVRQQLPNDEIVRSLKILQ